MSLLAKSYHGVKTFIFTMSARIQLNKWRGRIIANGACKFSPNTHIGNNCNFNGLRITGKGRVIIGDYFHSGEKCRIISSFHDYEGGDAIPYGNANIDKDVIIENFVWIGEHVYILGGVTIGEGAVIQAGSVVVNNIPRLAVAGGHPAKPFKYRDRLHFEKLKNSQSFY